MKLLTKGLSSTLPQPSKRKLVSTNKMDKAYTNCHSK